MIEKIKKALYKDNDFVHEYVEDDTIYLASTYRAVLLKGKHELEHTGMPGIKKAVRRARTVLGDCAT